MSRRIAKFFVTYVGASAGALQFVDWMATRYFLSKSLVDLLLCVVLLMLPTVLLIAWATGRAERHDKRVIGVGVPLNFVVTVVVLFIVFHGKRLGATTDVVEVRDDNGALVNRRVAKTEYRKKVMLFSFESTIGDANLLWLKQGVPYLLAQDLAQDQFVDVQQAVNDVDVRLQMQRARLTIDGAVPLALARQLAMSRHYDFFVTGSVDKAGDVYRVRATINSAQRGVAVSRRELAGTDLFAIVDTITPQLRKDVGVPEAQLQTAPDLPVSEITTRSLPALGELIVARNAELDDQPTAVAPHLEKAIALDPGFALAHLELFYTYFQVHQTDKTRREMDAVAANAFKLPEAMRFQFTAVRYLLDGNVDKQKAVLTNWVTLYPHNKAAWQELGNYYGQRDDRAQAAATFQRALALDPSDTQNLRNLVEVYELQGDNAAARAAYQQYLAQYPNDSGIEVALGLSCLRSGRFDEARAAFERGLSADAENVAAATAIIGVDFARGDYDGATARLQQLLAHTTLPRDRVYVYDELVQLQSKRGQMQAALATARQRLDEHARYSTPASVVRYRLRMLPIMVEAGRAGEAEQILERITADDAALRENVDLKLSVEMARCAVAEARADATALAACLPRFEETLRTYGLEGLQYLDKHHHARLLELGRDLAGARAAWHETAQLDPDDVEARVGEARCARQLGDNAAARVLLERTVAVFPSSGAAQYELAMTTREPKPDAARAALAKALAVWAPADAGYKPAADARALGVSLGVAAKP